MDDYQTLPPTSSTTNTPMPQTVDIGTLTQTVILNGNNWDTDQWPITEEKRIHALEQGDVLFFPELAFLLSSQEQTLLTPTLANPKNKNISFNAKQQQLNGLNGSEQQTTMAIALLERYQQQAHTLVAHLFPHYQGKLKPAPASLRLHRVETRSSSWRQDDTRLHVDAFPSRPNHGQRILRVFCNISPRQEARVWRVGARFTHIAQQFLPQTKPLLPGAAWLMHRIGITKQRRSAYDQIMLQLHDAMKRDEHYQQQGTQANLSFPPGSTWICYSDQVPHAVMSGQFMMEQTYFLDAKEMAYPQYAPLATLERLTHKKLV